MYAVKQKEIGEVLLIVGFVEEHRNEGDQQSMCSETSFLVDERDSHNFILPCFENVCLRTWRQLPLNNDSQ